MEIIGFTLLIVIEIVLTCIIDKYITNDWNVALFCSIIIIIVIMLATFLLVENKSNEYGVKEYLRYPERYSIKVVYEDSIPVDTIVELK